jgi:hypothetical protein
MFGKQDPYIAVEFGPIMSKKTSSIDNGGIFNIIINF